jgi:oligoribonuclease
VDLELSGLDIKKDKILEIACILTDGNLEHQILGPEIVIQSDKNVLDNMDEWCTK